MVSSPTQPARQREQDPQCAFCGYPIPNEAVYGGGEDSLAFCSEACAGSFSDSDEPWDGRDSSTMFATGVPVFDTLLPWGMRPNAFVLLAGEEGMRHRGLQTELVWRALNRGEPCVVVSFVDAPPAVVEKFLSFGWNVLPFLESGDLHVIDCFTERLREGHQVPEKQTARNAHFNSFLDAAVTTVRDPTNLLEIESKLHKAVEELEMVDRGLVVIDSIVAASTQGREDRTEQFIEEIRADLCQRLSVPIFTSTTITDDEEFSEKHAYIFDGIIDMVYNEQIIPNIRLKEMSVRKMDGVRYRPDWVTYENTGRSGFAAFDPRSEFDRVYPFQNSSPYPENGSTAIQNPPHGRETLSK